MIKKKIASLAAFTAGDATSLREVFHPKNDEVPIGYSLAEARLAPNTSSYPHILEKQSELYLFIQGEATVFVGGEPGKAQAGDIVWIPAGVEQYVKNTGGEELIFYCIVNPPWDKTDEKITMLPAE